MSKKASTQRSKNFKGQGSTERFQKEMHHEGAIAELDVFDYQNNNRTDIPKFHEAKIKLLDYIGARYGHNAHIIEHNEEFPLIAPAQPADDQLGEEHDPWGFTIDTYREDYKAWRKRYDAYQESKPKVYHILWGQCTTSMKNMVKRVPEYNDFEARKDPLALWREIANISMIGTAVQEDAEKRITEAKARFQRVKQKKEDSGGDYLQRFELEYQSLIASGTRIIDYNLVPVPALAVGNANQPLIDSIVQANTDAMAAVAVREERQKALMFINSLDRFRFGGLIDDLQNAFDRGRNEYPVTMNMAYQMVINYRENGRRVDTMVNHEKKEQYGAAFVARTYEQANKRIAIVSENAKLMTNATE